MEKVPGGNCRELPRLGEVKGLEGRYSRAQRCAARGSASVRKGGEPCFSKRSTVRKAHLPPRASSSLRACVLLAHPSPARATLRNGPRQDTSSSSVSAPGLAPSPWPGSLAVPASYASGPHDCVAWRQSQSDAQLAPGLQRGAERSLLKGGLATKADPSLGGLEARLQYSSGPVRHPYSVPVCRDPREHCCTGQMCWGKGASAHPPWPWLNVSITVLRPPPPPDKWRTQNQGPHVTCNARVG